MEYTIGEFSRRTNLTAPALRYYEQEELLVVARDAGGRRFYTEADETWVLFIKRLKDTGMPIREIRQYAKLRYQGESMMPERLALLKQHQKQVLAEQKKIKEHLKNLETKIQWYEDQIEVAKKPVAEQKIH